MKVHQKKKKKIPLVLMLKVKFEQNVNIADIQDTNTVAIGEEFCEGKQKT